MKGHVVQPVAWERAWFEQLVRIDDSAAYRVCHVNVSSARLMRRI